VFLLEPGRTPYDLNFRLGTIPVRVHPMFWLFSALLGWDYIVLGVEYVLLWVACTFVSILVHELGHVLMGMAFGHSGSIVLYSFGGLAIGSNGERYRWQRIAVSAAGPGAGLALFGAVCLVIYTGFIPSEVLRERPILRAALSMLFFMNLFWNLLNLIPVWPLDGGQIARELCVGINPRNGARIALGISFVVAGLLAVHSVLEHNGHPLIPFLPIGGMWLAILFALLAIQSFQLMQQSGGRHPWEDDEPRWKRWN
jgi:Zn-dependent protease